MLRLLLPINEKEANFNALDPVDYPCSLAKEFNTAANLTRLLLEKLGVAGQIQQKRLDDGGVEGEPCSVLFPDNMVRLFLFFLFHFSCLVRFSFILVKARGGSHFSSEPATCSVVGERPPLLSPVRLPRSSTRLQISRMSYSRSWGWQGRFNSSGWMMTDLGGNRAVFYSRTTWCVCSLLAHLLRFWFFFWVLLGFLRKCATLFMLNFNLGGVIPFLFPLC
jgi:hypothetical protein